MAPVSASQNFFVFGYGDVVCATCGSIHPSNMAFLLQNTNVYSLNDSLIFSAGFGDFGNSAHYPTIATNGNAYLLSSTLMNNFPGYLLNAPDSTYGLSTPSWGYLVFAIKTNGVLRQWRINQDTSLLPSQIRPFIAQTITTLDTLYHPYQMMAH